MKFRSESTIAHPRPEVFAAYRDQLPEVVDFLDDIKAVNVLDRQEKGDVVELHNEWVSDTEVPAMAKGFLKPEHLQWDDYASWDEGTFRCAFEIKTRVFRDSISCTGTNTFLETATGTKVVLEGDFEVAITSLPGVPSFVAKRMMPQVEKFIVALIQPNLAKTNEAVGRFLDAKS